MTDDFSDIERLTFEHVKATHELQQKKDKWEKLKKEYADLREKLTSFPLKLRHDYKVPIGSVGFFEGHIIHTNEIMVLLGDNWFTQCSANHAIQIVDHRVQVVEKNLKDVCEEINFLESRKKVVESLSTMDKAEGIVDIREESNHKSRQSTGKKKHIAHKSKHDIKPRSLKDLDREKSEKSAKKELRKLESEQDTMEAERLFARLDELELEEKMTAMKEHEARMRELKPEKANHVRFKDNAEDDDSFVNNSTDDIVNNEENCIRFKHTKAGGETTEKDLPSNGQALVNGNEQRFISPADIYAQFMKLQSADIDEKPLKSILKKERKHSNEGLRPKPILKHSPEHKSDGSSGDELSISQANEEPKPILKAGHEAVCGTVIERTADGSTSQSSKEAPRKKVSRFKASRMKK